MHFPHARWPAGADRRKSPLHARLAGVGAQFGAYNGWERADWFARPGDDTGWEATQTWDRAGPWAARVAEECVAVRDSCGVIAISGFTGLRVTGPGARRFVDGLSCSRLPKPGRIGLAYFPDHRGRVLTEMSVLVEDDDAVGFITAGVAQWHDAEIFRRQAPEGITVTDYSDVVECLLLTGPEARDILAPLTNADLSMPWLSVQFEAQVAGRPCALVRVSFAGELGWEIHCDPPDATAIWDAVTAAGAKPFGMWALNALRIEKAYRAWKGELSTDYTLLEAGLARFIDWDKDFPGKAALLAEKAGGVTKRFVVLTVDAPDTDPPYMANIWAGDRIVGEVTSAAWGHRVDACVALGMIRADLAHPGTAVDVEIFGKRRRATVRGDGPLWDAANERMRA
jgi:dimethylglycine dehydrogenase